MKPPISVIMPVRDGARWLGEAITSIQDQTLSDFELIIIDDGSSDESPSIIEERSLKDPRIRAIRQERLGLVSALNRGLAESRGQFIARLDADDRALPHRLEHQSQYLKNHPRIGLLGTWANQIDEHGSLKGSLKPPTKTEQLVSLLARTNPFLHSSIMARKAIMQKVGFYRAVFEGAEDYDLWIRMSEVTNIENLPEFLLDYRVHPANVSYTTRVRQLFSTRLAQRAAQSRRATSHDPTSELIVPPNWQAAETMNAPIYGDLARLFCLLDLANPSNVESTKCDHIDISSLSNRNIVLNHAERRMAQLALLNLLKKGVTLPKATTISLLRHFIQLHPLRALYLGYQSLWKN